MMLMMMMMVMMMIMMLMCLFLICCCCYCPAYLRPSRELLEYYRKKIAEFDDEHESMLQRLDQYRTTYEEQVSAMSISNSP